MPALPWKSGASSAAKGRDNLYGLQAPVVVFLAAHITAAGENST